METLSVLRIRIVMALLCSLFLGGFGSMAEAQQTPYPDNEARNAILRERQRVDAIRIDFDKLRGDAQVLKNAQLDLLMQLEEARKEVRDLRGKIEEMQAGGTNSTVRPDVLQQLMEQQRNFEERLNSLAITRK